jgi:TrpR-related protein YerC/YecD
MANWHNESTDRLVRVLTNLSSEEECYRLLEDLCTIKEVMDMAQRLEVAILLKNRTNYQEINRKTGVSTATISRVNKCLSYGSGGYAEAMRILGEDKDA